MVEQVIYLNKKRKRSTKKDLKFFVKQNNIYIKPTDYAEHEYFIYN